MIVSIIQPALFPWLGYFDIIKRSDVFVFFDNVQFEKRNWQMRNKIKVVTKDEETWQWISMPTTKVTQNTLIKDALIDNNKKWKSQHLNAFQAHYGNDYKSISFLTKMYEKDWEKIVDFNIEFITNCCAFFGIDTKLVRASDLSATGKRSQLLLNICKELGATEYLSGPTAKAYLENDREIFDNENIKITYHDYKHPVYKQKGKTFIEKLSILDLLFNEKENSSAFF